MLETNQTVFVLIDVQGKLAEAMYDRALLCSNIERSLRGAKALGLPVLWLEQNPSRMGRTIPQLRHLLEPAEPIAKMSFSAWGEKKFTDALLAGKRKQVLLAGIEAHVCVYQTAAHLVAHGYDVRIVADAVSSRTPANRQAGIDMAVRSGAGITTVESFLFELMRSAEHPAFKAILNMVK